MKKKSLIVVGILILIGIAVIIAMNFNKSQRSTNNNETHISESTEKVPSLKAYYGTTTIANLDGYIMEMNQSEMRDSIIPVSTSREATLELSEKDIKVQKISYETTSTDNNRLIDSGEIKDWKESENKATFKFQASAIMNPGDEYFLKINVETSDHDNIYYYTRIVVSDKEFVQNQIKFAKQFTENTFDSSKSSKLVGYLEPDLNMANDNFGSININASYTMLIWGNFSPKRVGDIQINAKEICIKDSGEAGTYTMNYQVSANNSQKVAETYNVSETITVWTCNGQQYVLSYRREINQVWEETKNNIGSKFIDLGIQNINEIEHVESEKGSYVAFAINGDVYTMNLTKKQIVPAYKLGADNSDTLNKTKAKVMNVDEDGNLDFMVYGYSLSDKHRGKNGISILKFNAKDRTTTEILFIPSNQPAEVMNKELSNLCYIGDGALYITLNNTIYFANLETKEWGTLAKNLEEGAYAVSNDKAHIAYNTSGTKFNSKSITIVNLNNGKKQEIQAGENNAITVYGYTGKNLVYGVAENISTAKSYTFLPVSKLIIIDENYKEVRSYSKNNVYIRGVDIKDTIINIKRWKKNKNISDEQLLDNTETKQVVAKSSYYTDELKLNELALSFTDSLNSNLELSVGSVANVTFNENTEIKSSFEKTLENNYYVYYGGRLQNIYQNKEQAIKTAKEELGLVTNDSGNRIWTFEEHYN